MNRLKMLEHSLLNITRAESVAAVVLVAVIAGASSAWVCSIVWWRTGHASGRRARASHAGLWAGWRNYCFILKLLYYSRKGREFRRRIILCYRDKIHSKSFDNLRKNRLNKKLWMNLNTSSKFMSRLDDFRPFYFLFLPAQTAWLPSSY